MECSLWNVPERALHYHGAVPRPDRHRAPLLQAAGLLLRRQGYAATATGDVLREAGATNGSLYHHFPGGKEELARAALDQAATGIDGALRAALAHAPDLGSALTAWVDALVAGLEADPRDGCPVAPTAIEAAAVGGPLQEAAAGAFARWTATLAEALEPTLGARAAPERARVLLATIEGALLLDRTAGGTANLRAVRGVLPALARDREVPGTSQSVTAPRRGRPRARPAAG